MDAETHTEAPFGEWLLRKLRQQEMSLSDVARLAQCDYTYLWRLVNVGRARGRQYRRPSYAMAERVGRALGATHEALTAAGYLPVENVRNSRVVDALDRIEQQLGRLREELAGDPEVAAAEQCGAGAAGRSLPLIDGPGWPEDPDGAPERIELPAWLAAGACWAVRVSEDGAGLQPGDLALIRPGSGPAGRVAAVRRQGQIVFVIQPAREEALGTVVGLIRRMESD